MFQNTLTLLVYCGDVDTCLHVSLSPASTPPTLSLPLVSLCVKKYIILMQINMSSYSNWVILKYSKWCSFKTLEGHMEIVVEFNMCYFNPRYTLDCQQPTETGRAMGHPRELSQRTSLSTPWFWINFSHIS